MYLSRSLPILAAVIVAGPLSAQTPDVAPEVTSVVTGGYWEAGEVGGQYRLVVHSEGFEHVHSVHHLQWIVQRADSTAPEILASVPLEELNEPFWVSNTDFESRGGAPVFILEQTNSYDLDNERVVEVYPGAPSEYQLKVVGESRDL